MSADWVQRFASFRGGDWGNLDPSRAGDDQFFADNMILYDSGLLGVRPGFVELNVVGLPDHVSIQGLRGFEIWRDHMVVVANQPFRFPIKPPTDPAVTATALDPYTHGSATGRVRMIEFGEALYANLDGRLYKHPAIDVTTTTPIALPVDSSTLTVKLTGLTRWNYYLVGYNADVPNRLWFSTVDEGGPHPDVWGANNFLDVGSNEPIVTLMPIYNTLYVGKRSGWYAVSGLLHEAPYVRRVTVGNGPVSDFATAMTTDNRVIYWGAAPVPVWFNGDTSYLDSKYRIGGFEINYPVDAVGVSPTERRIIMLGEPVGEFTTEDAATRMLYYDDKVWSSHTFAVPLGGVVGHDVRQLDAKPTSVAFFSNRPRVLGDPVRIYAWDQELGRPSRDGDPWASPLQIESFEGPAKEIVEGYLELPAQYDPQSRMVLVRSLVIQFRHWPCNIDEAVNELHVKVIPLGGYEAETMDTEAHTWVKEAATAAEEGTDETWRIGFGAQGWTNGYQIVFPRIRGIALRSIEVHVEVRTARL